MVSHLRFDVGPLFGLPAQGLRSESRWWYRKNRNPTLSKIPPSVNAWRENSPPPAPTSSSPETSGGKKLERRRTPQWPSVRSPTAFRSSRPPAARRYSIFVAAANRRGEKRTANLHSTRYRRSLARHLPEKKNHKSNIKRFERRQVHCGVPAFPCDLLVASLGSWICSLGVIFVAVVTCVFLRLTSHYVGLCLSWSCF